MKLRMIQLLWFIVTIFVLGCEDSETSDPPPSIDGEIIPCGSDIVGQWTMTEGDIPGIDQLLSDLAPACAGAITNATTDVNGTMAFGPAGASSIDGTLSQSLSVSISQTCLDDLVSQLFASVSTITGIEINDVNCSLLGSMFQLSQGLSFDAATCTLAENQCQCELQKAASMNEKGPYTIVGTSIVNQNNIANPYCVQDDYLVIAATTEEGMVVNILLQRE